MKAKDMVKGLGYKFHVKNVCKNLILCFVIFGAIIFTSSMVMAEYIEQPANESSTISAFDGNDIFDFEFAKLIEENIGNNSAEMIFIFGTCYGGGMIDDLDKLQNKSKLAAASASRHNNPSWGGSNFGAWTDNEDYYKKAFHDAIESNATRNVSDLFDEAEQNDVRGPNGAPVKEHPQKKLNGSSATNIKIGNQSDNATSFHTILFIGQDAPRHQNDLRRMNDLLIKNYGFTNDTIHVLALDLGGSTLAGANVNGRDLPGVPIDGNGTLEALNETLKQIKPLMNTSEQFLFWADGHGDNHKVNRTITMVPHEFGVTYTVPIDPEMIDQWFEGSVTIFAEGVTSEETVLNYFHGKLMGSLDPDGKTVFSIDPDLMIGLETVEITIENVCNSETVRVTSVTVGGTASGDEIPMIESADSSGNKKDTFIEGDKVYSFGSKYGASETYDLYIVEDRSWTDGMSITPYVIKTTVSTDVNGDIVPDPTLIWSSAIKGKYDIVVDVEGNGNYDQDIDPLDDADVNDAGFEVPVLTPVGMIALIGLLLVVTMSRIKRR